jgi:hypothetical protein
MSSIGTSEYDHTLENVTTHPHAGAGHTDTHLALRKNTGVKQFRLSTRGSSAGLDHLSAAFLGDGFDRADRERYSRS